MGLVGFKRSSDVVLSDESTWAAGEVLVDEGQNTIQEVAAAGESAVLADIGTEVAGFSETFADNVITDGNITDSKAQQILNETDITKSDLTGLASVLYRLSDDWEDNNYNTTRDTRDATAAENLGADEFSQNFRPEWADTGDANVNAAGGSLVVSGGSVNGGTARTASLTYPTGRLGATGEWQVEFSLSNSIDGNAGDNNPCLFAPVFNDNDNMYYVRIATGGPSIDLVRRRDGGTNQIMSTGAVAIGTSVRTVRVTIEDNGDMELFYEGVSEDTTNNGDLPRYGSVALLGSGADTDVEYNWIQQSD